MSRPLPGRDTALDAAGLQVLCGAALTGLATTFAGWAFWLVGATGVLVGIGLVLLCRRPGWPVAAPMLAGVAAALLLGPPVALRRAPTPDALVQVTGLLVDGWKDLLTTLPPVDADSPLLVLPWLLGLAAGLAGQLLAGVPVSGRGPLGTALAAAAPLAAPASLLALVILLGAGRPQSLLLQGSTVALAGLGWLVLRSRRRADAGATGPGARRGRVRRGVAGAALVGVAAAVALPLAGSAGVGGDRVVLRRYVEPPFDVGRYPSPLASFRRYVEQPRGARQDPENLYDDPLLTVEGVPPGTRIRFAALDEYDGVVWGAGSDAAGPPGGDGTFQRVSSRIDNPAPGRPVRVRVTVEEGYRGVWLPVVGSLTGVEFDGPRGAVHREAFRYNLATATGVLPTGLEPGDRYRFDAVVADRELTGDTAPAGWAGRAQAASGFLGTQAQDWSQGSTRPIEQVLAVAEHLRLEGKYSDGVRASERFYLAGHHRGRLLEADGGVASPIIVGNDEQYAAWMALLATQLGVPARVVMGAVVPPGGTVTGADVQAWVEVQAADRGWRTLPTEAFMDFDRPAELPPREQEEMSGTDVPPPAPIPPPSTLGEQTDAELNALRNRRDADKGLTLPAWLRLVLLVAGLPALVVALLAGAVVGLKAWRRRRRRNAAPVSARFVGGWREVLDHARDLGVAVTGSTRREQAGPLAEVGEPELAGALARRADTSVFGPRPPEPGHAASYWREVDRYRASMSAGTTRAARLRAAVSPRTLLGRR